jgi:hypothetical protein
MSWRKKLTDPEDLKWERQEDPSGLNVEQEARKLMEANGILHKLFDMDTLIQMLEVLIDNAAKQPRPVIVFVLRIMIRNGLGSSLPDLKHILSILDRKSLMWKDDEPLDWALAFCEAVYVPQPCVQLIMHQVQWRLMLWTLCDAPLSGVSESPLLFSTTNSSALLNMMVNFTPSHLFHDNICRLNEIDEGFCNDWASLFTSLLIGLSLNVQHALNHSKKQHKKVMIAEEVFRHALDDGKSKSKGQSASKQKEPVVKEASQKALIIQDKIPKDAYDRRIERISYVTLRFMQQNKVDLKRECLKKEDSVASQNAPATASSNGYKYKETVFSRSMRVLNDAIHILTTKSRLNLLYPRIALFHLLAVRDCVHKFLKEQRCSV